MPDVKIIALSLRPFSCKGDFAALREAVAASGIPEFDALLRAGVQQFKRQGLLRTADIMAIEDVLNARLTELAQAEAEAIKNAERTAKADVMGRWLRQQLLDTDDLG